MYVGFIVMELIGTLMAGFAILNTAVGPGRMIDFNRWVAMRAEAEAKARRGRSSSFFERRFARVLGLALFTGGVLAMFLGQGLSFALFIVVTIFCVDFLRAVVQDVKSYEQWLSRDR